MIAESSTPNTARPPLPAAPTATGEASIQVRDISKMYRIYDRPQDRLKQMLWRGQREFGHAFWALQDVSFEVMKGEIVGVIGRNGSGKSTLLQIIAGTLAPTAGEVQVNGRVAALLELGTGFNPEFTGRENVMLNGALLGMSREEMLERFDEIAAFADIGEFIDQPVKLYSSGMLVRVAFAVQACIEPEVMIVDEALAVGDVFFQQKCYRRLDALRAQGTSILFVSHNLGDVRQYCQRAIVLHGGRAVFSGSGYDAVSQYMLLEQATRTSPRPTEATAPRAPQQLTTRAISDPTGSRDDDLRWPAPEEFFDVSQLPQVSNGWARCLRVAFCDAQGRSARAFEQGDTLSVCYEIELLHPIDVPVGGATIENDHGVLVHGKNSLQYDVPPPGPARAGDILRFRQDFVLNVAVGDYTIEVGLATIAPQAFEHRALLRLAELYDQIDRLCHLGHLGPITVTFRADASLTQLPFWGVTDLPGDYAFQVAPAVDKARLP